MKKFEVKSLLVMLLALAIVFAFAACKGNGDDTTVPNDDGTEPTVTDPTEIEPTETDPGVVNPPVTDPVETEPKETDPVESDPPKVDPIETDPPETKPVETDPPETKPADTGCAHSYTLQITVPPSCFAEGEQAMVCSVCGDVKDAVVLEPAGHQVVTEEREVATLTHHHALVKYCTKCSTVLDVVELTEAHSFASLVIVPKTFTDGGAVAYGYEVLKCEGCDYTVTYGSNAADGHYYTPDEGSGKLTCKCGALAPADVELVDNPNAGFQLFPVG